jgi:hypothetical protein
VIGFGEGLVPDALVVADLVGLGEGAGLMKAKKYPIPAMIEYEYNEKQRVLDTITEGTEVLRLRQVCARVLCGMGAAALVQGIPRATGLSFSSAGA